MPDTHPLHQISKKAKESTPDKHHSPIDQLLKTFKLRNAKIETIDPATQNRTTETRFTTQIADSREASIVLESVDDADYRVYSDGSGQENDIGASAILYKKGYARPLKSLQQHLGLKTRRNTFEAEAVGAILALWLVRNTQDAIGKKASMYIDNQAVIKSLLGAKPTSGQHLINAIRLAANAIPSRLAIKWISSHSEVKGNEAADKLAKAAAQGRSSRTVDLPHILRTPLPASASATKQNYHAKLNKLWIKSWLSSPRKDRFSQIDADFPFNRFRKKLFTLTRKQTSLVMQIRTGHIPLNFYLRRIGKADSDRCTSCYTGPNPVQITESINHFLFDCQTHDVARQELIAKIGRRHFSLKKIMTDTDYLKALVTYINRTGRFREDV